MAYAEAPDAKLLSRLMNATVVVPEQTGPAGNPITVVLKNGRGKFLNGIGTITFILEPYKKSFYTSVKVTNTQSGVSRRDVIAIFDVDVGGTLTFTYAVLFEDKIGVLAQKDFVFLDGTHGSPIVKKVSTRASAHGGDYDAVISILKRKDDEPQSAWPTIPKDIIRTVSNGVFTKN